MNYISAKEISEKWSISGVLILKYCRQHGIPGVKFENGSWLIPENAKKLVQQKTISGIEPLTS